MGQYYESHGLQSALRVTVCDIRDESRPPQMRTGPGTQRILESMRLNAEAGADFLSIESTGGKEISDRALMEGDMAGLLLALGVLAPADMRFLWQEFTTIVSEYDCIPAGDSACGFANTAMIMADKHYIPNVLAAVVRGMSAVRSQVAFEQGAVGPSKDCAYEGPVLKAITGCPISMEGKSSACAHFSHLGNIAGAACDLWSNESVQNVRLLSGAAPEVFAEILAYDCRLFNQALSDNTSDVLRRLLIESDVHKSLHAFIISPDCAFTLAEAIVKEQDHFQRTRAAGLTACALIREAADTGGLTIPERELPWLDRIEETLEQSQNKQILIDSTLPKYQALIDRSEYEI